MQVQKDDEAKQRKPRSKKRADSPLPLPPLTIEEAIKASGFPRNTIYNLINAGDLKSLKVGKRRFIARKALEECITLLEARTIHHSSNDPEKRKKTTLTEAINA